MTFDAKTLALVNKTPHFPQPCNCCTFLGAHVTDSRRYDLYFCLQGGSNPTVIARYGVDEHYNSGLCFSYGDSAALTDARLRAIAKGLIAYDLLEALRYTRVDGPAESQAELKAQVFGSEPYALLNRLRSDDAMGPQMVADFMNRCTVARAERLRRDVLEVLDAGSVLLFEVNGWMRANGLECFGEIELHQALGRCLPLRPPLGKTEPQS